MPSPTRILDANANRAREALRVMEEAARFLLDDADLSAALKEARHDLASIVQALPAIELWRDTPGDVGTAISTQAEGERASSLDVVVAAGKRLSESLRVMEEYAKTLPQAEALPGRLEALRYRAYDLELRLHRAMGPGGARQWRLCVLISEALCPQGAWHWVAERCIAGGADCIQLREKDLEGGELLKRARALAAMTRQAGVSLIVNDRPDVALLAGADGVHLGQGDLPCAEARRLVGRQLLIGVSTSKLEQAKRAKADGADYCGVGPMFATRSKHKPELAGPAYLRTYRQWDGLPHLAIGGVDADNLDSLVEAGAQGVAISSAACRAADPADLCRTLRDKLP